MKQGKEYRINRRDQLAAVGSPIRQLILDTVAHHGEMTVAQLAALIGRRPAGLHHHLKMLYDVGLLLKVGMIQTNGRPAALIRTPARRMRIDLRDRSSAKLRAMRRSARATLRLAERDFLRSLELPGAITEGPTRSLWVARAQARLSGAELKRLNRAFGEVVEILTRPGKRRGRLIAVTWSVAPVQRDSEKKSR